MKPATFFSVKNIYRALNDDTFSQFIRSPKLEEKLIHFVYANKPEQDNKIPASHKALRTREYIDTLKRFNNKLGMLYIDICSIVHPEAPSVEWMLDMQAGMPWTIEFVATDRASAMNIFILDKYKTELNDL